MEEQKGSSQSKIEKLRTQLGRMKGYKRGLEKEVSAIKREIKKYMRNTSSEPDEQKRVAKKLAFNKSYCESKSALITEAKGHVQNLQNQVEREESSLRSQESPTTSRGKK